MFTGTSMLIILQYINAYYVYRYINAYYVYRYINAYYVYRYINAYYVYRHINSYYVYRYINAYYVYRYINAYYVYRYINSYYVYRYINAMFRLLSFDGNRNHPGHFCKVVVSHLTIFHLMQVVREEMAIESTRIVIFTDKSCDESSVLAEELSLEDCGFVGGTKTNPKELLLYYDYVNDFTECPLLLCDHYFGRKIKL